MDTNIVHAICATLEDRIGHISHNCCLIFAERRIIFFSEYSVIPLGTRFRLNQIVAEITPSSLNFPRSSQQLMQLKDPVKSVLIKEINARSIIVN